MHSSAVSYQLFIRVSSPVHITIGKLGTFLFPAGNYVYTGSARSHLHARIRRHLKYDKRLHWHIDYLLADPQVSVTCVNTSNLEECRLNQQTMGTIDVPGFGASDCRRHCGGHLKRLI